MTAYILSPEVHAQIVDALNIGIAKHYDLAQDVRIGDALAMLKAMKPVEHIAELMWDEEKQKSYMQYTMPIGLLLEGSKLYAEVSGGAGTASAGLPCYVPTMLRRKYGA